MPEPAWQPATPAVDAASLPRLLRTHRVVVLHFWAAWNAHDRAMDETLRRVSPDFAGKVEFRAMDTESPANWAFILQQKGIVNLPALALYVKGIRADVLVGLRSRRDVRVWIEDLLEKVG